jgi:cell shape-determining protein MreC
LYIVDNFTNKAVSNFIPNNVSIVSNVKIPENLLDNNFLMMFESKSNLLNENLRLKNEVLELRRLKVLNYQLKEELESNNQFIKKAQFQDIDYISTRLILKNANDELLINGGRNLNFNTGDLVLNSQYVIVGYLEEVFNDYSILETLNSPNFSID